MAKWSERPKRDRWVIVGAFIGMAIAAVVAFNFAYESSTIVRYFIMAAGLLLGGGGGALAAQLNNRPPTP